MDYEERLKKHLDALEPDELKKKLTTRYRKPEDTYGFFLDTPEHYSRNMIRTNQRLTEDAEELTFPDNPAELLERYKVFADTLNDDTPAKHNIKLFIIEATDRLDKGDKDAFKKCLMAISQCEINIFDGRNAAKALKPRKDGATGGKRAAELRAEARKKVKERVKEEIIDQKYWDNWRQDLKSITDTIWPKIEASKESGKGWRGISNTELQQAKVGRNSVYDAVKETDCR